MPAGRGTTARAKRPTAVVDDVRSRVLAGAVKLIEEGGLAGLSMREVARAAGVSHQAPYHYFQDRESILAALAEEGFNLLTARLENAFDPTARPTERLAALGRVYAEFACDQPALFRVMFRPDFVNVERFPDVKACGKRAFDTLFAAVQACIEDGLPPAPSMISIVVLSWSLAHGLACLLLDGPLKLKLPELARNREAIIHDVVAAMTAMLDARTAEATQRPKSTSKPRRPRKR